MYYAVRQAYTSLGEPTGFYVSVHPHSEAPASHHGRTFNTPKEARQSFEQEVGYSLDWCAPDEDVDPDIIEEAFIPSGREPGEIL